MSEVILRVYPEFETVPESIQGLSKWVNIIWNTVEVSLIEKLMKPSNEFFYF